MREEYSQHIWTPQGGSTPQYRGAAHSTGPGTAARGCTHSLTGGCEGLRKGFGAAHPKKIGGVPGGVLQTREFSRIWGRLKSVVRRCVTSDSVVN